jgi:hypothetical protein
MATEVSGVSSSITNPYYGVTRTDSREAKLQETPSQETLRQAPVGIPAQDGQGLRNQAKKEVEEKPKSEEEKDRFAAPEKTYGDEEKKSFAPTEAETKSQAYFRDTLAKPFSQGANLYEASLAGSNLRAGDLSGANLGDSDLSGADLSGADLRNADFSRADLTGANLTGANLTGATFTGATIVGTELTGAIGAKYDNSGRLTLGQASTLPRFDFQA